MIKIYIAGKDGLLTKALINVLYVKFSKQKSRDKYFRCLFKTYCSTYIVNVKSTYLGMK